MSGDGVSAASGDVACVNERRTYRWLLLGVLARRRLRAQVRPDTAVASAVDAPTARCLCVEDGQLCDPPLEARRWRLIRLWIPPHQPLPIIAAVFLIVVGI